MKVTPGRWQETKDFGQTGLIHFNSVSLSLPSPLLLTLIRQLFPHLLSVLTADSHPSGPWAERVIPPLCCSHRIKLLCFSLCVASFHLTPAGLWRGVIPSCWVLLRLTLRCCFACPGVHKALLVGNPQGSGSRAKVCGQKVLENSRQLCHLLGLEDPEQMLSKKSSVWGF